MEALPLYKFLCFQLERSRPHGFSTEKTSSLITSSDYTHRIRPADRLCHSTAHDCVPGGADSGFSHQHSHHCLLAAEVKEENFHECLHITQAYEPVLSPRIIVLRRSYSL